MNTRTRTKKTEQLNSYAGWIYAAASIIAQDESSAQYAWWKREGATRDEWERVGSDVLPRRIPQILARPNANQLWSELRYLWSLHKSLTGEAYLRLITTGNRVDGVELIYPHWVEGPVLNAEKTAVAGWKIHVPGHAPRVIPADEIITDFLPHPSEPLRGMSPVEAFALSYDLDLYAKAYGGALMKNRAVPDILLTTPQELQPQQSKQLEDKWMDKYSGNAGGIAVLHSGAQAQVIGMKLGDLAFIELAGLSRDEIMMGAYGVPLSKRGGNAANKSVADMQDNNYAQNTLLPRLRKVDELLNYRLIPRIDRTEIWLEHDTPVKRDEETTAKNALDALKAGALTVNQYLGRLELPPQGDDGDVYLVPLNTRVVKSLAAQADTDASREVQQTDTESSREAELAEQVYQLELEKRARAIAQDLRGWFARCYRDAKAAGTDGLQFPLKELEERGIPLPHPLMVRKLDETMIEHAERLKGPVAKQLALELAEKEMKNET